MSGFESKVYSLGFRHKPIGIRGYSLQSIVYSLQVMGYELHVTGYCNWQVNILDKHVQLVCTREYCMTK